MQQLPLAGGSANPGQDYNHPDAFLQKRPKLSRKAMKDITCPNTGGGDFIRHGGLVPAPLLRMQSEPNPACGRNGCGYGKCPKTMSRLTD